MKLKNMIARIRKGAVTVDWVVLTAAIVGLGIAVLTAVGGGVAGVAEGIGNDIAGQAPPDFTAVAPTE